MLKKVSKKRIKATDGIRIAIVAAKYNSRYVNGMLNAAKKALFDSGITPENLKIVRVPGAFETPVVAARLAAQEGEKRFDAIIGLGVILQGATSHAEHIGMAVTQAFATIQVNYLVPIVHEVLVFTDSSQARDRCLSEKHNRGAEAANTALEMAKVLRSL
jgi:6,7-dimethyl-8-ribityllumazine synthase